ncbi:MAG: hypothetical protein LQ347_000499 [Umbilicaria vellea]|nr:MAG: hypothetical protein LQ347_000499 [Umbilicaria vellea]
MSDPTGHPTAPSHSSYHNEGLAPEIARTLTNGSATSSTGDSPPPGVKTPNLSSSPPSPAILARNASFSNSSSYQEDWEAFPPLDRLTVFDLLDNLALPQRLERWQNTLSAQTVKVRRQREKLKSSGLNAKERVVEEWRRRVPPPDEQLDKYRKRVRASVDRLGRRWHDTKAVTVREKVSFIAGVLNIFISGYLIGAYPDLFYYWFTLQLCYFMPIRYYTYQKLGYHYFLADLCYFVNLLLLLSIWVAPRSKRLFISTYCLAYGNNAVAIAMWRNSMVFHSLDKVTSPADSEEHYSLWAMMIWATVPYALWQLSYHFLITVRRREKIAAGRPTSFTWLRKSYAKSWIGRLVLSLPEQLQETAFMLVQYVYALGTMVPCPLWFWYRWASAGFLMAVFVWSIYNGATYYIDVFGKRFQNELEQLKRDVAKWQTGPEMLTSPLMTPRAEDGAVTPQPLSMRSLGGLDGPEENAFDRIPLVDAKNGGTTALDGGVTDIVRERK